MTGYAPVEVDVAPHANITDLMYLSTKVRKLFQPQLLNTFPLSISSYSVRMSEIGQ